MADTPKTTESGFVSVAAVLLLEREGLMVEGLDNRALRAQAQIALDEGIPLAQVLDAPAKTYARRISGLLMRHPYDGLAVSDTETGRDFGLYRLRQPTGRDIVVSERGEMMAGLVNCFALCADMPLDDVKAMPYDVYIIGASWLGEEVGVSEWFT